MADNVNLVWSAIYGWFGTKTILEASKARHKWMIVVCKTFVKIQMFIVNVTDEVNKLGPSNFPTKAKYVIMSKKFVLVDF